MENDSDLSEFDPRPLSIAIEELAKHHIKLHSWRQKAKPAEVELTNEVYDFMEKYNLLNEGQ